MAGSDSADIPDGPMLALDIGEVRTGVAISDALGVISRPYDILSADVLVHRLRELIERERVCEVLVGIPKNLSGETGHQARRTLEVVAVLREEIPGVRFIEWDERFTTRIAGGKRNKRGKKQPVDDLAAAHMLQEYLNTRRGGIGPLR